MVQSRDAWPVAHAGRRFERRGMTRYHLYFIRSRTLMQDDDYYESKTALRHNGIRSHLL